MTWLTVYRAQQVSVNCASNYLYFFVTKIVISFRFPGNRAKTVVNDSESFSSLKSNNATLTLRFIMHPGYLGFWHHLNDHSPASTQWILMRMSHNQNTICIFVVFEGQLLAIPVAKDLGGPSFDFFDQILKIWKKSMCTSQNRAFRMKEISLA